MPADVVVLQDPAVAAVALDPVRSSLLDELAEHPSSAAAVAAKIGVGRSITWRGVIARVLESPAARGCVMLLHQPPATGFLAAEGEGDEIAVSGWLYLYGDRAGEHAVDWDRAWTARLKEG